MDTLLQALASLFTNNFHWALDGPTERLGRWLLIFSPLSGDSAAAGAALRSPHSQHQALVCPGGSLQIGTCMGGWIHVPSRSDILGMGQLRGG